MKLTFLGTGDAFSLKLGHTSALLEWGGENLVIDFPATNWPALKRLGRDLQDVKNVFITHLHEDHVNGLQQLAHYRRIVGGQKPNLLISRELADELWQTVKAGLAHTTSGPKRLEDYFEVILLDRHFELGGAAFELIPTRHTPGMTSFGLLTEPYFFFTGDTSFDRELLAVHEQRVSRIFHDCHMWELEIPSHTSLAQLQTLPAELQKKLILMHYQDGYASEEARREAEEQSGFCFARPLEPISFRPERDKDTKKPGAGGLRWNGM
ncbi:MBL fold metallo-hydrolase [Brevibacillus massiliensis]|uniref:MBL fold metallo-hydrolase n=1 Tax=Brevibacillus massiliensis TaxID=1118054 RepID=UPI0002EB9905|nr:MBL fold metallo-hydrolase [Brevibacillus massiliensis]